jgi:hypothetical protein
MKLGQMPGFYAEAALRSRRVVSRLAIGGGGLGYECTGPDPEDLCFCQGYDDCINMLVFACGPYIRWAPNAPICICSR